MELTGTIAVYTGRRRYIRDREICLHEYHPPECDCKFTPSENRKPWVGRKCKLRVVIKVGRRLRCPYLGVLFMVNSDITRLTHHRNLAHGEIAIPHCGVQVFVVYPDLEDSSESCITFTDNQVDILNVPPKTAKYAFEHRQPFITELDGRFDLGLSSFQFPQTCKDKEARLCVVLKPLVSNGPTADIIRLFSDPFYDLTSIKLKAQPLQLPPSEVPSNTEVVFPAAKSNEAIEAMCSVALQSFNSYVPRSLMTMPDQLNAAIQLPDEGQQNENPTAAEHMQVDDSWAESWYVARQNGSEPTELIDVDEERVYEEEDNPADHVDFGEDEVYQQLLALEDYQLTNKDAYNTYEIPKSEERLVGGNGDIAPGFGDDSVCQLPQGQGHGPKHFIAIANKQMNQVFEIPTVEEELANEDENNAAQHLEYNLAALSQVPDNLENTNFASEPMSNASGIPGNVEAPVGGIGDPQGDVFDELLFGSDYCNVANNQKCNWIADPGSHERSVGEDGNTVALSNLRQQLDGRGYHSITNKQMDDALKLLNGSSFLQEIDKFVTGKFKNQTAPQLTGSTELDEDEDFTELVNAVM